MSKKAIGWLYFLGMPIFLAATFNIFTSIVTSTNDTQQADLYKAKLDQVNAQIQQLPPNSPNTTSNSRNFLYDQQTNDQLNYDHYHDNEQMVNDDIPFILGLAGVSGILVLIAWIGTVSNLSKGREWVWLVLTFLFGGIIVLAYVFGGPPVPKKGELQQGGTAPSPGTQPSPVPSPQPQVSALDILQMRLARGEIDGATFQQISEQLRASERR